MTHPSEYAMRSLSRYASWLHAVLLGLLMMPAWVFAQGHVFWSELTEAQRNTLAPFEQQWNSLPAQRQQRLLQGADRWQNLGPNERREAQNRLREWNSQSPEQQQRIREQFNRFRALPQEEQTIVRDRFQSFQALPENRRYELREQFRGRAAGQERTGPGNGRDAVPPGRGTERQRAPFPPREQ
jgi:hypothetical protein